MPDDENTTATESENIQAQEPTEPALENTTDLGDSHPSVPVEELEADGGDLKGVGYDNIPPPEDFTPSEPEKIQENQAQIPLEPTDPQPPNPASNGTGLNEPKPETPQIPVNEALPESEPSVSPLPQSTSEASEAKEEPKPTETPEPKPQTKEAKPPVATSTSFALALLVKARNAIQFRKRRKLDRIMTLFEKKNGSTSSPQVTNDEVEKLLRVSDATASRYLSQLEKEGKIKQSGKTGRGVSYSRI